MPRPGARLGRPLRPFSAGLLISEGFRVTLANLGPFFLITLICLSPGLVFDYLTTFRPESSRVGDNVQGTSILGATQIQFLLGTILGFLAQATICYGTIQFLSGRRASIFECVGKVFSRLLPVIGVSLLVGVLVVAGIYLLIVPGLMLASALFVAVPAAVMEAPGVGGAMKRSFVLTKGHRLSLCLVLLALATLTLLSITAFFLIGQAHLRGALLPWLAMQLATIFFTTASAVFAGVAYALLRERKEGVAVAQLAEVFS